MSLTYQVLSEIATTHPGLYRSIIDGADYLLQLQQTGADAPFFEQYREGIAAGLLAGSLCALYALRENFNQDR